jgi:transcriptional regulator with XRE-family HTH domain
VGSPKGPTLHRRRLARKLREMREDAGLTLVEAAPRLDKTKSALSRVENGETTADVHLIRSMMDLYKQRPAGLLELARVANQPGWWRAYGIDDRGYIGMENDASAVFNMETMYVCGLLQTEDYMRAVFGAARFRWTAKEIENQVAARSYRQRRLTSADFPLRLHTIMDEAALCKPIGGPEVRKAQWRRLIEAAELDTVTLQVVPHEAGMHAGMDGAFTILEFIDDEDPDLLFVSHVAGALHLEKPDELVAAKLAFDCTRSSALSPGESVDFMERMVRR